MSKEIKETNRFRQWLRDIRAAAPPDDELAARIEAVQELIEEAGSLRDQFQQQCSVFQQLMVALAEERYADKDLPDFYDPDPRETSSIELVDADAGPCVGCGHEVGRGMIGWSWQPEPGPLCDRCFGDLNEDLGAIMGVVDGLRQITAASQEPEAGPTAMGAVLYLARLYAQATAGTWPLRPAGVESLMESVQGKMEERHGMFWLSELERSRGDGQGEPN